MEGGRDDSGKHLFIPLDFLLAFSDPPSTEARGHILSAHNRTTEQLVTSLSMCVSGQQQHNTAVMKSVLMLSSYSLTPNNINKSVCSFKKSWSHNAEKCFILLLGLQDVFLKEWLVIFRVGWSGPGGICIRLQTRVIQTTGGQQVTSCTCLVQYMCAVFVLSVTCALVSSWSL